MTKRQKPPVANIATLSTLTTSVSRRFRRIPVDVDGSEITFIIGSLTERERKSLLEDWLRDDEGHVIPARQEVYSLRLLQLCLFDQLHQRLCEVGSDDDKDQLDDVDAKALNTLSQVDSGVVQFLVSEIVDHTRIRKASVADAAKNSD